MKLNEEENYLEIDKNLKYISAIKGCYYYGYRGKKENFKKEESIIVSSNMKVFEIKSQKIKKEIKSKNFIKKILNIVDYYEVETIVEEIKYTFPKIKDMISNAINYEYYNEDLKYNVYDEIEEKEFNILLEKIKKSNNIKEIFELLQINNEDNIVDTF